MYLLSHVTVKLLTELECPSKTVSCLFSKKFQILIVLSLDPEIIYLLSLVITIVLKEEVCPSKCKLKFDSIWFFISLIFFENLNDLSLTSFIHFSGSLSILSSSLKNEKFFSRIFSNFSESVCLIFMF